MLSSLPQLIRSVDSRYGMIFYLAFLLFFSSLALVHPEYLWRGLLIVLFYTIFDLLLTYVKSRVWYLPLSSWVSGLILALISAPDLPLVLTIALPALAVFSKHFIRISTRHIFNPAAFAVGIAGFFAPAVSWWAVSWAILNWFLMTILILGGLFILWKQQRFSTTAAFLAAYALFLFLLQVLQGPPLLLQGRSLLALRSQLFDGTLIFFITVMLIEPKTSSFYPSRNQNWYGVLVAAFVVLITFVSGLLPFLNSFDPLIFGLLLGNLLASLLFL